MAVDVVVVNYHTDQMLKSFEESYNRYAFEGCTLTKVEVEVPTTEEDEVAAWFRSKRELRFRDNVGYGRACNMGAQLGQNDVILLANADTELSDGFETCYNALVSRDDWGVLGPRQVNEFNQIKAGGIGGPDRNPQQLHWDERDHGQASHINEDVLSVAGSLYFIKREVWDELRTCQIYTDFAPLAQGAFLETRHYFEDMFCSLHARAHGYKCVFFGPVKMMHHWHAAHVVGSWQDKEFYNSQAMHRAACKAHGIVCE